MNREEITRMAREAGFEELFKDSHDWVCFTEEIERFAALIAAVEREACAELCEQMDHDGVMIAADCAEAIRARGQA